ncbi:hypothetical protein MSAN_02378600 [Mycena sanguinolenta]|uniref:Protein kinase domain-containing protein n=1 Tax=Mycena sanguinolenta TaxID=230812 RepID=A0A8H6X4I9_9AGAR|nr:hypothetical protein MSAN_02378600 [Mycena sanguinolenta]
MDPQADSDEEFIVLSTSDYTETASRERRLWGGEGGAQGGDGGTGHGPTVYFGQSEAREPSEFRTIRLGDLKLIEEFKEMRSSPRWSVVGRQTPRATVRQVYKAKLEGRESSHMTVAMYEGDGAEEVWNQHLANYESIRHPNIVQLYGFVRTKWLRGMVFHDELIPYLQFRRRFEHSSILRTYIIAYCITEFREATNYIENVSRESLIETSVWIRPSTGELCLDLTQNGPETGLEHLRWKVPIPRLENMSLDAPDSEDIVISSFSDDKYHELCSWYPIARFQCFQVTTRHPIGPEIFWWNSQYETCVRITGPLVLPEKELHWNHIHGEASGELSPKSWIRYDSSRTFFLELELKLEFWSYKIGKAWLAQANHIFAKLQEVAHAEDYVCINEPDIPDGYLFVCPPEDLRTNTEPHANLYQWPACPAYWSLNPSGADRLSTEDAKNLGFPTIHIETVMHGWSWDCSVYRGLRRFHEGKGFDPDSREVARQLGYPLFEVLSDCMPFPAREVEDWPYECKQDDPALCRSLGHYL